MGLIIVNGKRRATHYQLGVTYLAVLFMAAIIIVAFSSVTISLALMSKREKEMQLLEVGRAYQEAIGRYYESGPGDVKQYPNDLKDLLLDPRHLATRRYLRKPFRDPVAPTSEWALVIAPDGGIMGIHSQSLARPIKRAGFSRLDETFENSERYSDWIFVYPTPSRVK